LTVKDGYPLDTAGGDRAALRVNVTPKIKKATHLTGWPLYQKGKNTLRLLSRSLQMCERDAWSDPVQSGES
jgi:hypothetical protein